MSDLNALNSPPGKFIPVYITAKLIHAKMLVDIRQNWPRLYFTARWPLTANLPSESAKPASLWTQDNETDLLAARAVVCFSHDDEATPLRDPLWELGVAHAHRKPIYLAGKLERFGKYAHCSSIAGRYEKLESALQEISKMNDYSHADILRAEIKALGERMDFLSQSPLVSHIIVGDQGSQK